VVLDVVCDGLPYVVEGIDVAVAIVVLEVVVKVVG